MDEIFEERYNRSFIDSKDVQSTIKQICSTHNETSWEHNIEINLKEKNWRPSAVSKDRRKILYVLLQDEFPRFVKERLRLAVINGFSTTIALPVAFLSKPDISEFLASLDADVLVLNDREYDQQINPQNIITALAEFSVQLSPTARRNIARAAWSRIGIGTAQERGKRLETLLAFIFSQVSGLKVVERNYRTETEEIDLVLRVENFGQRVWQALNVPYILVEAKNRIDKASQQVMSTLLTKLQTKRGTTRLAFLISLAGFTNDAGVQELRYSTQDKCVVMIGKHELELLIDADDLDNTLEKMVRHALMR